MNITKHEFLHDRVLIEPEPEKKDESGFIGKTENMKLPPIGTVIAVGNGKMTGEPDHVFTVKEGDKIKYERHIGEPYEADTKYLLIREKNIIAILPKNK